VLGPDLEPRQTGEATGSPNRSTSDSDPKEEYKKARLFN